MAAYQTHAGLSGAFWGCYTHGTTGRNVPASLFALILLCMWRLEAGLCDQEGADMYAAKIDF